MASRNIFFLSCPVARPKWFSHKQKKNKKNEIKLVIRKSFLPKSNHIQNFEEKKNHSGKYKYKCKRI
jgi:hypothetical protein